MRGRKRQPTNLAKVRGRGMVFIGAYMSHELRRAIVEWANEEDRTISQLVYRILRFEMEKSNPEASDDSENEPERKSWPTISLAPPVKMTIL